MLMLRPALHAVLCSALGAHNFLNTRMNMTTCEDLAMVAMVRGEHGHDL